MEAIVTNISRHNVKINTKLYGEIKVQIGRIFLTEDEAKKRVQIPKNIWS